MENANLNAISLRDADLLRAIFITVDQIRTVKFWYEAIYNDNFRQEIGLLP
ncbi:hypothetical protein [Nostoc sp.]|uniref:hypothetical protein n=1 Tax=Nostoc sp. TaxID=1180 RepID=UPI003FA5A1C4